MSGMVLGPGDRAVSNTDKKAWPSVAYVLVERAGPLHTAAQAEQSVTAMAIRDGTREGDRQKSNTTLCGNKQRMKRESVGQRGGQCAQKF